jgi:hypothetical protein
MKKTFVAPTIKVESTLAGLTLQQCVSNCNDVS